MVADAEANAEEDKVRLDLINARNSAEAMVHSVKKSMDDHSDKLTEDEKKQIEEAIKETEAAISSEDKDEITTKTENLMKASQKLGEMAHSDMNAASTDPDKTVDDAATKTLKMILNQPRMMMSLMRI